jgi:hypothetical protein
MLLLAAAPCCSCYHCQPLQQGACAHARWIARRHRDPASLYLLLHLFSSTEPFCFLPTAPPEPELQPPKPRPELAAHFIHSGLLPVTLEPRVLPFPSSPPSPTHRAATPSTASADRISGLPISSAAISSSRRAQPGSTVAISCGELPFPSLSLSLLRVGSPHRCSELVPVSACSLFVNE